MLCRDKARKFAYWYFWLRDPQRAAEQSGMENPIVALGERKVQEELAKLRKSLAEQSAGELAKLGLCRILFSQPMMEGGITDEGFAISKCSGNKGGEYQFLDKIKVCELLLRLEELEQSQRQTSLSEVLSALQQQAQDIKIEGGEEE